VEVITLEVTPEEAEKLALAATEGKIQLALRNFSDSEDVITKGMTIPVLLTSYSTYGGSVPEAKAVPVRATGGRRPTPMTAKKPETGKRDIEKKPGVTVELIKGTKASEVKFEGGE
jgi:pilus assembly protein CpaB